MNKMVEISSLVTEGIQTRDGLAKAVVKDYAGMELEHHHEKMGHRDYFNSGMMYLNLQEFRRIGMREKLLEAKATKMFPPHFMDQDAFNLAFAENVRYLSPEYNLMRSNNHLCESLETVATFYGLSLREYLRIESNPAIVHLSNYVKPWDSSMADLYELYLSEVIALDRGREGEWNQCHC